VLDEEVVHSAAISSLFIKSLETASIKKDLKVSG
jgi:hypothetical protein